ncbi:bifunctional heptose 7-phosphate kinase/heptose 1-phosphate adenyltransferase [Solidesulfovibrio aerotolerans]
MNATTDLPRLAAALEAVAGKPILVVGDCMLDHYLMGDVGRISPEAPVPVVRVASERHTAGGAGNVARNLVALGAKPFLVSATGDDDAGRMLAAILESEGIEALLVRDRTRPTTIKTRIIAQNQQVVRVDRESDAPLADRARRGLIDALTKLAREARVIVVSDYAKGVIGRELMDALRAAIAGLDPKPLVLVDPKPANAACYAGVDLLTPNLKETLEMAGAHGLGRESGRTGVLRAGLALFKATRVKHLCVTLGPEGIALFRSPSDVTHLPTVAKRVYDVTGAGDSVMAALACGLAAGLDLLDACVLSNYCAGIAVSQVGAVAVTRQELAAALATAVAPALERWLEPSRTTSTAPDVPGVPDGSSS